MKGGKPPQVFLLGKQRMLRRRYPPQNRPNRWLWIGGGLAWAALLGLSIAAPRRWLSGSALEKQLDAPAMILWEGLPFAEALGRIRDTHRVPLVLGRAVDPQRPMQLVATGSVRLLLEEAVEFYNRTHCHEQSYPRPAMRLGISFFDQGVYIGSEPLARGFRTLLEHRRQELAKLPRPLRQRLFAARRFAWPELTSPRKLLDQLAQEAQVTLVNVEQLPHDLWRSTELPPAPWYVRLSLVLVQFGATFEVDPTAARVVLRRIHEGDLTMQKLYPAGPRAEEKMARWKKWCPKATITRDRGRIVVTGTWEDHRRIASGGRRRSRPTPRGVQVYTLRVLNKPVREVVQLLAQRLGLRLQWSPEELSRAGVDLQQLISFYVENATREELFRTLLEPLGMRFQLQGQTLRIAPAKPKRP